MSFIPFFILKTVYEESFYLKRSARVLVVPLLSLRAYARNPPVSEPEMELVIPNEYEESPPAIMAGDSSLHFVPFRMTWLSFRKHVKNLFFCSSWEVKMFRNRLS